MQKRRRWVLRKLHGGRLPWRWLLGCQTHDVPILVAAKLLKPLGNPPPNGIKFFATVELLELMKERCWLVRVTVATNAHWHRKNALCKRAITQIPSGRTPLLDFAPAANG
jgi:hypothetical protein